MGVAGAGGGWRSEEGGQCPVGLQTSVVGTAKACYRVTARRLAKQATVRAL